MTGPVGVDVEWLGAGNVHPVEEATGADAEAKFVVGFTLGGFGGRRGDPGVLRVLRSRRGRIRSANGSERFDQQLKRRTRVARPMVFAHFGGTKPLDDLRRGQPYPQRFLIS